MYVDEVYYPNLTGSMVELLDIDRVEIARGPQGTLSGRNSIGGSVKIYSVEPTHGGNTGTAELTLGNYEQVAIKGAADLTFVEGKLSARISGISSSRNGYVTASTTSARTRLGPARRSTKAGWTTARWAISAARASRAVGSRCCGRRPIPFASRCSAT